MRDRRNQDPGAAADVIRCDVRLDVGDALPVKGDFEVAATVVWPSRIREPATLLVCLPGGFLGRGYFDLSVEGSRRFSFAEAMATRGCAVATMDHVGTGDSTRPEPLEAGYEIGIEAVAAANQRALEDLLDRLETGRLDERLPATGFERRVGVGHSMGSMLTVEQQAAARPYDALLLFSFSTHGTPAFLDEAMRSYANRPERLRQEIGSLARASMGSPYPARATNSESDRRAAFGVGTAGRDAEEALHAAATNLLAVGGLASMVPGGFAPPAEVIDVPVLMVFGDHDLHDDRHTRAELPRAPRVETFELEDAWHCHFVANGRERLWRRTHDWLETLDDER